MAMDPRKKQPEEEAPAQTGVSAQQSRQAALDAQAEKERQAKLPKNDVTGRANQRVDKATEEAPFLGTVGKEITNSVGGTAKVVGGVLDGNKREIKEGAKMFGESVLSATTGGALRSLNKPPPKSHYGGSAEEAAALKARNAAGIDAGLGVTDSGLQVIGTAVGQAGQNRNVGLGMVREGGQVANTGMLSQDARINASLAAANQPVNSVAEAQMRMAADRNNAQMMAQASAARGGNQAAALRSAQAIGSQNSLETNQQAGLLRLQEEQARRAGIVQANQSAAGMYGDRAQLGYSVAGQGLGAATTATGQTGQLGQAVTQVGTTTTGQFLGADTAQNQAQIQADAKWADEAQKSKGGVAGVVGKVIGSIF